jgi:hypothetical protein
LNNENFIETLFFCVFISFYGAVVCIHTGCLQMLKTDDVESNPSFLKRIRCLNSRFDDD